MDAKQLNLDAPIVDLDDQPVRMTATLDELADVAARLGLAASKINQLLMFAQQSVGEQKPAQDEPVLTLRRVLRNSLVAPAAASGAPLDKITDRIALAVELKSPAFERKLTDSEIADLKHCVHAAYGERSPLIAGRAARLLEGRE